MVQRLVLTTSSTAGRCGATTASALSGVNCRAGLAATADGDAAAARLLLQAPPDLGERTSIFVCGLCADLDCGATSVIIERDGDEVIWRDPAATGPRL